MNRARLAGKNGGGKGDFIAIAVTPFAFRTAVGRMFSLPECRFPGGLPRQPLDLYFFLRNLPATPASQDFSS